MPERSLPAQTTASRQLPSQSRVLDAREAWYVWNSCQSKCVYVSSDDAQAAIDAYRARARRGGYELRMYLCRLDWTRDPHLHLAKVRSRPRQEAQSA